MLLGTPRPEIRTFLWGASVRPCRNQEAYERSQYSATEARWVPAFKLGKIICRRPDVTTSDVVQGLAYALLCICVRPNVQEVLVGLRILAHGNGLSPLH